MDGTINLAEPANQEKADREPSSLTDQPGEEVKCGASFEDAALSGGDTDFRSSVYSHSKLEFRVVDLTSSEDLRGQQN